MIKKILIAFVLGILLIAGTYFYTAKGSTLNVPLKHRGSFATVSSTNHGYPIYFMITHKKVSNHGRVIPTQNNVYYNYLAFDAGLWLLISLFAILSIDVVARLRRGKPAVKNEDD